MMRGTTMMDRDYRDIIENWRRKQISTLADLDAELSNFRILFAYNSNLIENPNTSYHNTREIFENGKVINYTGDTRTIFELENQRICYDKLRPYIIDQRPLSVDLIKEIHKLLMRGCYDDERWVKGERPGAFKKHDYIVGDNIGTPADEVESEIKDLCEEVNAFSDDKLLAAAYLHLNFESIHPFADGNGRVGRTLMNYYLMINNHPPLIIYGEDKDSYYMGLALFDVSGKLDGFIKFLKEEIVKTWTVKTRKKERLATYTKR